MIEISIPGQSASKEENKQQLIRLTEIKMKKTNKHSKKQKLNNAKPMNK